MKKIKDIIFKLLRKSEGYTKTDMVYLFSSNIWLNISKFLSIANGLALSVAFAHLITKEEYGVYTFVLAIIGLFTMGPTTALGNGIIREAAQGNHQIIFEGQRKILPWSILTGAILFFVGIYYETNQNPTLFICFALAGLILPILIANSVAKSFLSSVGDFKSLTNFNLWRQPIITILLILAILISKSILIVIIVHLFGNLLLGLFLYKSVTTKYKLTKNENTQNAFAGKYAFHSAVLSFFSYLSEKIDSLVLWKLLGAGPLAVYTYAMSPIRELRGLLDTQSAIALPRFAKRDFNLIKINISHKIRHLYLIAIPIAVVYVLLAPYIFKIFFPQYLDSVILTQIASISLLSAPRRLISVAISAHQKIKESYIMNIVPNIIKIVSVIIFVPLFGLKGAVYALILTEIIDYLILGILMKTSKGETNTINQ